MSDTQEDRFNTTEVIGAGREIIEREGAAVSAVAYQLDESFVAAVRLVSSVKGKVVTTGAGTSGIMAHRMAHILSVTGTPAFYLHPSDGLHGGLGAVTAEDVVIALSKGGDSTEVSEFVVRAKERGARVIALTADLGSTLAGAADVVIGIHTSEDADPGGMIAMGSVLATAAWGDALATALMRLSTYSWKAVQQTHPRGAVGHIAALPRDLPPIGLSKRSPNT
jgi:arabinose-5-phosphate isomerase